MSIDRHELEHRNWRSSASNIKNVLDRELAEQLKTSIVPDDNEGNPPALGPKQVKHKKIA